MGDFFFVCLFVCIDFSSLVSQPGNKIFLLASSCSWMADSDNNFLDLFWFPCSCFSLSTFIYLSVSISVFFYNYQSIFQSLSHFLFIYHLYIYINLLYNYLSIYLSIFSALSIYLPLYLSISIFFITINISFNLYRTSSLFTFSIFISIFSITVNISQSFSYFLLIYHHLSMSIFSITINPSISIYRAVYLSIYHLEFIPFCARQQRWVRGRESAWPREGGEDGQGVDRGSKVECFHGIPLYCFAEDSVLLFPIL